MNKLFDLNLNKFNSFINSQAIVDEKLQIIGKLIQEFINKSNLSAKEYNVIQTEISKHSLIITKILTSIQKEYLNDSKQIITSSINLDESPQKMFEHIIENFIHSSKNSYKQYFDILNNVYEKYNNKKK